MVTETGSAMAYRHSFPGREISPLTCEPYDSAYGSVPLALSSNECHEFVDELPQKNSTTIKGGPLLTSIKDVRDGERSYKIFKLRLGKHGLCCNLCIDLVDDSQSKENTSTFKRGPSVSFKRNVRDGEHGYEIIKSSIMKRKTPTLCCITYVPQHVCR